MSELDQAKRHLSQDPILKPLITKHQLNRYWGGHPNYFLDLIDIVTGQQISLKAAATIYQRFVSLFEDNAPNPKQILEISNETLRSIGLSRTKSQYLKNIATALEEGSLNLKQLSNFSDEEVSKTLTAIKGLGSWSAEMFLMFSLKRPDVFSIGDLGVCTAISRLYQVDREDKDRILEISKPWRPFRTYACRYLWASLLND